MLIPGKAESWFILIDCEGCKISKLVGLMKEVNSQIGVNFPACLYKNFIINVPKSVEKVWKLVKVFL